MQRRSFRLLWGGQFAADAGGQLTAFALPAIAIVLLGASPLQVGTLQAFEFAAVPLLATLAGVIADRRPRRALMIGANLVRLIALATLPAAWALHVLSLAQFFVVGGVCAAASVLFDTAYTAFLPAVVGRDGYAAATARLAMSGSVAEAVGASSAGAVVQFLGAPAAIALNVGTMIVATLSLVRMRVAEVRVAPPPADRWSFIAGFRLLAHDAVLRAVALCTATAYLGGAMVTSVFALYCYRDLHLSPAQFGLVMGLANIGLLGAFASRRMNGRFGERRTLALATMLSALGKALFLIHAAPLAAVFAGRLLLSFSGPIASTTQQTVSTARVDDSHLGRLNAAMRTVSWGALPAGSLLGGLIGEVAGTATAIALGSSISLGAAAWLLAAPQLSRRRRALAAT